MTLTAEDFIAAFEAERQREYPAIDAFESQMGYAVGRDRLERAALVLACPVKANPPNWQHGRVLYAVARHYLAGMTGEVTILDIGTAKGFSALCLQWALDHSGVLCSVHSVDVIDPHARVERNTVAEVDGVKTLPEILADWPEAARIDFRKSTGQAWLQHHPRRVHLAYVDGKHAHGEVSAEAALLSVRQDPGDVIVFDDLQIPGVHRAVSELRGYDLTYLEALPTRQYAIARKR